MMNPNGILGQQVDGFISLDEDRLEPVCGG